MAPVMPPGKLDTQSRSLLRSKRSLPGWKASVRVGVRAKGRARQLQLFGRLAAAIRMAQAPGSQLRLVKTDPRQVGEAQLPLFWSFPINVAEARTIVAWPIGPTSELPVHRITSRQLAVPRAVPTSGRILGTANDPRITRPVALSPADSLHHLHLVGPTGVGKSTALLNLIVQDLEAGRSVVVLEPKGDLVDDVLARVPDHRLDDVVVIDPTDEAPVGVNPLSGPGTAEMKVDGLLAVFEGLFGDAIGPRTHDLLSAGLLTLCGSPNVTLVDLPRLFTDPGFRNYLRLTARDPLALDPFWQWYEALSPAEQNAVLAPLMNKVRRFLLRPQVRRTVGQMRPRFDVRQVFTERRVLLVNLAKGSIGAESAALLGSVIVSQLWRATLSRQQIPPERRHPVMWVIDEFQDYLRLPSDLADVLSQARALGVGLHLAHQHLAQLSPAMRAAVLANARSRVVFQTGADDARTLIGSDKRLTPADIEGLGKYAAYASLMADGESTPYSSIRTMPPPPTLRDPVEVRRRSRQRWGIPSDEIEAAFTSRSEATAEEPTFGIIRRAKGDAS
jgi:DNA helicase HerA-like ATPase